MKVIGLMSGTSADAVDAALIEVLPGNPPTLKHLYSHISPYPTGLRQRILQIATPPGGTVSDVCRLNAYLGELFAQAALELCRRARVSPEEIDLIGSHGQTVRHLPEQTPDPILPLARREGMPPRVLVVEDDPDMRALLEEILDEGGFRTVGAADALTALITLLQGGADVMITDWKMPAMDGLTLLHSVRRCAPGLPVVFITAFAHPELRRRALEGGARSFLPKPFQRRDLLAHVLAALHSGGTGT